MDELATNNMNETEFGLLPEGWSVRQLGGLVDRPQYGVTATAVEKPVGPKFLRITDIQDGQVNWSTVPYCDCDEDALKKCRLASGDLVVARIGATTGKTFLVTEPAESVFASYLIRLRTTSALVPNFLNFFTKSKLYWTQIDATKGGRLKQGVNIPTLQSLMVPVPPLTEQQDIAHVLRTVQQAKEATEKVIAAARQLKQSLMRHLFTYGPVPFDQADRVPLKETDYGQVPEGWGIRALNECATVQTGVAKGRKIDNGEAVEVPYLRVANVQDGYLDLVEMKNITIRRSETTRYSLQPGDVVLTEGGDFDKLGRGFIWNGEVPGCVHQNHIFAVRSNRAILVPEFLAYLTQSAYGKSYFLSVAHKTTNLACINTTKLKALPVVLPSLDEQHKIVAALRGIDKKTEVETRKSAGLDALFQTLLHNLMTGKVRVPGAAVGPPG